MAVGLVCLIWSSSSERPDTTYLGALKLLAGAIVVFTPLMSAYFAERELERSGRSGLEVGLALLFLYPVGLILWIRTRQPGNTDFVEN